MIRLILDLKRGFFFDLLGLGQGIFNNFFPLLFNIFHAGFNNFFPQEISDTAAGGDPCQQNHEPHYLIHGD